LTTNTPEIIEIHAGLKEIFSTSMVVDIYHIPKISLTDVQEEEEKGFSICPITGSWPLHLHSLLHLQGVCCPWHSQEHQACLLNQACVHPSRKQETTTDANFIHRSSKVCSPIFFSNP
jgi:hypothetical protein